MIDEPRISETTQHIGRCPQCAVADQLQCVLDEGHDDDCMFAKWPYRVPAQPEREIVPAYDADSLTAEQREDQFKPMTLPKVSRPERVTKKRIIAELYKRFGDRLSAEAVDDLGDWFVALAAQRAERPAGRALEAEEGETK